MNVTIEIYENHRYMNIYNKKMPVSRTILYHFEWFYELVNYRQYATTPTTVETKEIYNEFMCILKELVRIYISMYDEYPSEDVCSLHHPDLIFDEIIYNEDNIYWDYYLDDEAVILLKKYEAILFKVINRLDEWEFDLENPAETYMHLSYDDIVNR
jgi:hypothetical protein